MAKGLSATQRTLRALRDQGRVSDPGVSKGGINMRILAIDPGPEKSGWVVWDGAIIYHAEIDPNDLLLLTIKTGQVQADVCIIEKITRYGMAVSESIFETVFWSGRFIEAWSNRGFFDRIPRMDVKMHICHDSRAKDKNIRQALLDRFEPGLRYRQRPRGILKGLKSHEWAAFALAVYWMDIQLKP